MKKFLLLLVLCSANVFSQGCSDAGFCSVGNTFQTAKPEYKNSIETGLGFAAGEEDVTIFSSYVTYMRQVNSRLALSMKLTFASADGELGSNANLGDIYLTGNYALAPKEENQKWSLLFGVKAPLTNANDEIDGRPAPMVYQSSLGTVDLISGVEFQYKKWLFNAAIQLPVANSNDNAFFPTTPDDEAFVPTNQFRRAPDALLRGGYQLTWNKFRFRPNMLLLYHLGEDSFETISGERVDIDGSSGITLNGNLITQYVLNERSSLELSLAAPFVVRDERPDGLTRAFTAGLSYTISF